MHSIRKSTFVEPRSIWLNKSDASIGCFSGSRGLVGAHWFKRQARMYTIGNPLIARTMLEHDIAAGLTKRASTEENEGFSGKKLLETWCLTRLAERARAIQKETSLPSFPSV